MIFVTAKSCQLFSASDQLHDAIIVGGRTSYPFGVRVYVIRAPRGFRQIREIRRRFSRRRPRAENAIFESRVRVLVRVGRTRACTYVRAEKAVTTRSLSAHAPNNPHLDDRCQLDRKDAAYFQRSAASPVVGLATTDRRGKTVFFFFVSFS